MSETFDYGSAEELIKHIKERCDDIDSISINMSKAVLRSNTDGTTTEVHGVAMVINYCNGRPGMIHRDAAELLLNDGVLINLRIPVRLCLPGLPLTSKR